MATVTRSEDGCLVITDGRGFKLSFAQQDVERVTKRGFFAMVQIVAGVRIPVEMSYDQSSTTIETWSDPYGFSFKKVWPAGTWGHQWKRQVVEFLNNPQK